MTGENNNDQADKSLDSKDKEETTAIESKPADDHAQVETKPDIKTSKKKTGSILLLAILLIIIVALAAGAYFAWNFWQQYSTQQEQRFKALETAAAEQGSQVQNLSSQQTENRQDQQQLLNSVQASQEAIQQRLDSHTQRLRALAGTSRDDWLLAEARYLLRLASQRLLVERGGDGARALLESADKILLSVDDAGVLPVRNAIANEIIALKLAKTVDRQGLYLQLAAIKQQIQALPLIPFRPSEEKQTNAADTKPALDKDAPWHQSAWNSIKQAFGNLGRFVQIRRHDAAPELLISEKQQLQTINHLMLMFEQAQFALLHEEEIIYRNSLEEALKWWSNYYSHYNEYEVIRSEISQLQQQNIIQVLPNINRSGELLTDYIEQFHKLNTAGDSPKPATVVAPPLNTDNPPAVAPDNNNNDEAKAETKVEPKEPQL